MRLRRSCRDSLAKILYSKMFDWLVAAVNTAIGEDKNCAASVGVLDIYGFESFEYNDLEQVRIALPLDSRLPDSMVLGSRTRQ
jgi:myosin-5